MAKTPPLPTETLARVLRNAAREGRVFLFLAGGWALLAAAANNGFGALIGCLIAGTGALQLHGVTLLQNGESRGTNWLVRSQLLLLAIMLFFAAYRLNHFDEAGWNSRLTPDILKQLSTMNAGREQFLAVARFWHVGFYTTIGIVSICYQGAMACYYHRNRAAVATALNDETTSVDA